MVFRYFFTIYSINFIFRVWGKGFERQFILFEYPATCCGWDGATGDIIRAYIEKHGTPEEKEGYKQMKLLDF